MADGATVTVGLSIKGSEVNEAKSIVEDWI